MLKVAVTVSKKSNIFPSLPSGFLDPVYCQALWRKAKKRRKKAENIHKPAARLQQHKRGWWRRADGFKVCFQCFIMAAPTICAGRRYCGPTGPRRGCGIGDWLGSAACFGAGWATGVSSECHKLQWAPTARISLSHILHLRTEPSSQWW